MVLLRTSQVLQSTRTLEKVQVQLMRELHWCDRLMLQNTTHDFLLEGQVRASAAEHAFQRRVGELVLQSMLFSRVTLGVIIGREVR